MCELFGRLAAGKARWPLLIWGPVGSGKSYAGLAFCDLIRHPRFSTLEQECDAVMRRESRSYDPDELIVLDEIGERSKVGDLQYATLKGTLDHREFQHQRIGLYISNLSPGEIGEMFDDRVASRLTAGSVFRLEATDRRGEG